MNRYIIVNEWGIPHWNNALELPCTDPVKAEAEIARQVELWNERQRRNESIMAEPLDQRGRGWSMMIDRTAKPQLFVKKID